jgi:hypothetical protein
MLRLAIADYRCMAPAGKKARMPQTWTLLWCHNGYDCLIGLYEHLFVLTTPCEIGEE